MLRHPVVYLVVTRTELAFGLQALVVPSLDHVARLRNAELTFSVSVSTGLVDTLLALLMSRMADL